MTCHALGLVSLATAEVALRETVRLWHSDVGTTLLYGAGLVHISLALLTIYDRRSLRLPPDQYVRLIAGLMIPVALIGHFVGTRYAFHRFDLSPDYHRVVANLWATGREGRQLAVLVPGWLHGCLGLNFAFGHRRGWHRLRYVLFGAALLLPVLAAVGYLSMGRELAHDAAMIAPASPRSAVLAGTESGLLAFYVGLIAFAFAAQGLRRLSERLRGAVVQISYPGRKVTVPLGWTVLDASRSLGVAHHAMCGGRARCTTCRVRVIRGAASCPAPGAEEARALSRIAADLDVRLACQLRPVGDISVQPVLDASRPWWQAQSDQSATERDVAVLACHVVHGRSSAEADDAHDTIYALGEFYAISFAATERAGGQQCRHAGDSWTVLFGLDCDNPREACRQAIAAGRQIAERSAALSDRLALDLGLDARLVIGVHCGRVVSGLIGEGATRRLAAVGEVFRATESMLAWARDHDRTLLISQAVVDITGTLVAAAEQKNP